MCVTIIAAAGRTMTEKGWPIGKNGAIPWHNKTDLAWFKETTSGNVVIMGRKTYESIGKPLPNRVNIVISHECEKYKGDNLFGASSLEEAVELGKTFEGKEIFIIGGASIYNEALKTKLADKVMIDILNVEVLDADAFLPYTDLQTKYYRDGPIEFRDEGCVLCTFTRKGGITNDVDKQYLDLVNDIIAYGEKRDTRAGETCSVFSRQMRFNLQNGLPMLTTKKMFSKGCIHELLWFLKGDTNIKYLVDNGTHIWDDDAYRYYRDVIHGDDITKEEFLERVKKGEKRALGYTYGDLGPVYGAQWTNWYTNSGGINQVEQVIETLKTNPTDRRMIISAWNVGWLNNMALPPCHYCCQFYARKMDIDDIIRWEKNNPNKEAPQYKLSCEWHQRSVDALLGLPFNILSYAILTHIIAQCAGMDVDELIFDGGDCHVYTNQIPMYKEHQKFNNPYRYALPKLEINKNLTDIKDITFDDIKIVGYESYPSVKYPLSVGL